MKRNWIKVRNGLLDPKHVEKLGFCPTLLYLYILDTANWETGSIKGWKDREVALELDVPTWKVKEYRMRLKDEGYISCQQILHGQDITIDKWMTPFDTDKSTVEPDNTLPSPSIENSDTCDPCIGHVEPHVEVHVEETPIAIDCPSISETTRHLDGIDISKPSNRKSISSKDPRTSSMQIQAVRSITGKYPPRELYDAIISKMGDSPDMVKLQQSRTTWIARGYNPNSWIWLLEWYPDNVPQNGKQSGVIEPKGFAAIRELERRERGNN